MASVIVVEDDVDLREGLVENLCLSGLEAVGVGSALEFYQQLVDTTFDVAVLDVNLPDRDGYSIASFLSEKSRMGIVIMTGRGQDDDRIKGFSTGADLYFVKPVNSKELLLAVGNLARRIRGERLAAQGGAAAVVPTAPAAGTWGLDRTHWRLVSPAAAAVQLTAKEMQLVERLAARTGEAVSRQELASLLGQDTRNPESRGLDATIRRLRRKTLAETGEQLPVQTVPARGLVFSGAIQVT